ncbi:hypothetical protein JGS22_007290 [Streptomyces sp. P38-E01]|uniref:DUF7848 domain-containing protein n=1 Tax=Streptomyces tardus TaxID=2780544 RepID=A0A949N411_9ACTN|nr:hypothetical protein [Streptomyces tardus]MBU7597439.1 hypothetical protein [Streptomyces tardus]
MLRHHRWTITPATEPDSAQPLFAMRCTVCDAVSGDTEDRDAAAGWALTHSGRNPAHRTYRETLVLPYRTYPVGRR